MKKRIGIQGTLGITSAITALIFYRYMFPGWRSEFLDKVLDIAGMILILMGFLFRVSARGHKADNTSGGNTLVVDGPYAMTRNPMYTGTILMTTGVIVVLFQWWLLFVLAIALLAIYGPQIAQEEVVLRQRFGDVYVQYCKNVGRFFPTWRSLKGIHRHLAIRFSWLKRELPSIFSVIGVVLCVEIWQDIRLFGRGAFLSEIVEIGVIVVVFTGMVFIFRKK